MTAQVETFDSAQAFLDRTQAELAKHEVLNNVILGIAGRYKRHPERFKTKPYLATVMDGDSLRLAAMMTSPYALNIYLAHEGDGEACELLIRNLRHGGHLVTGVNGRTAFSDQFARLWTLATGQPHHLKLDMGVYELREVIAPRPVSGQFRAATPEDLEVLTDWLIEFQQEALDERMGKEAAREIVAARTGDGDVFVWEAGGLGSMAIRSRPTLTGISIGSVYTPPGLRGKGYASAVVAGLSQVCLDDGYKFCMLFTDMANATSNGIYQKIGYKLVAEFREYEFG